MKELSMYKQLVYLPYMTSYKQLVCGAIELDVFSQLAEAGGFTSVENRTVLLSTGTHDINILRA